MSVKAFSSYRNLPTPAESRGVRFILETASPPILLEEIIEYPLVTLRLVKQPWFPLIDAFRPGTFHFIGFQSQYVNLQGVVKDVAITRELLAIAWVDGLNGMRFHQGLLEHLRNHRGVMDLLDPQLSMVSHKLTAVCRDWTSCYREVDFAINLLQVHEQSRSIPTVWQWPGEVYIPDLSDSSCLHEDSTKEELSPIFIHAAWRLVDLQKDGYLPEFLELASAVGFKSPLRCQIFGLSDFDTPELVDKVG